MKRVFICSLMVISATSFGQTLEGSVAYNGSTFSLYTGGIGWEEDNTWIQANLTNSWLATIQNSGENAAVAGLLSSFNSTAMLGGHQVNQTSGGPADDWSWVHGEAWGYTNWNGGEPNDFNGQYSEQYLEMYSDGLWNDIGNNGTGDFVVQTTPEPCSMVALGAGIACLLRRRKRSA